MNGAELTLAFMAGLAGSAHCLGMCGSIVAAVAVMTPETSALQRFLSTLGYHFGRITTYTLLGVIVGAASQGALITSFKPAFRLLFLFANVMVVIIGVATAAGVQSVSLSRLDGTPWGWMGQVLGRVSRSATPLPFVGAGLVMGLIPCGLVYGVLLTTAGSGSWFSGGARMLAFGLGTLPALMLYGQVASTMRSSFGSIFLRLMGVAVAILGLLGIWETLNRMGILKSVSSCCGNI